MPIQIKSAPSENLQQFFGNVAVVQPPDAAENHLHLIPHKLYDLSLAAIAQGKNLAGATFVGWRYLYQDEGGRYLTAEVAVMDGAHIFQGVHEGPHLESFRSVHEQLHAHELVRQYHYELNLLRVPSCHVIALWLRGDDHHHEMLFPLAPVHPKFIAGETYSPHRFMDLVESIARERGMGEDVYTWDTPAARDDLTRIEGIGPKIAALLQAAGIITFANLAGASLSRLEAVLDAGGSRFNLANPTTWPEQAALVATGQWEALQKLQDELKGGRR